MAAMYFTIWLALALFVAGDIGRPARGAWWAFVTGLALAIVHTVLAFEIVHAWSHDDAVRNTAMQTAAVYGTAVGSGVYVNYVFFAAWLADAWWWRAAPSGYERPALATWALRGFYFVIILNAAVIFAAGWRRAIGAVLVAALVGGWMTGATRAPSARRR